MDAFGIVVIAVAVVAVLVAAASYWGSGRMYSGIGASDLVMDRESADSAAVQQEEIRQMLEAKSARREARGEPPLDVEAELAALRGADDPALREEVRQLVEARNARRARQGKEPLDVEAEIERQLRDLRG
jgi:hypothetical protein